MTPIEVEINIMICGPKFANFLMWLTVYIYTLYDYVYIYNIYYIYNIFISYNMYCMCMYVIQYFEGDMWLSMMSMYSYASNIARIGRTAKSTQLSSGPRARSAKPTALASHLRAKMVWVAKALPIWCDMQWFRVWGVSRFTVLRCFR